MNPKLYKLTLNIEGNKKVIDIISNDEKFNETRIKRILFRGGKEKPFKIIKSEVINDKLGL